MARGRLRQEATKQNIVDTTNCSHNTNKEGRGLGLPEAPVFYPTEQEFKDPLEYISQIRPLAEPFGICRIVPPKCWDPPFALDQQSFSFPTKLQAIHQLQERPAAWNPDTFRFEYDKYLESQGLVLESWPQFCGEELDLCKLYNSVKRHGGYDKVIEQKKWCEVLRMVKPEATPSSLSSAAPTNLSHIYEKHLADYEKFRTAETCKEEEGASKQALGGEPRTGKKRTLAESENNHLQVTEPLKRTKSEDGSQLRNDQLCEQCHSAAHEQMMINCDRCDRGWHLYCLSPPLSVVPQGSWYCLDCVASEQEIFGFAQGNRHTLDSFRRMCDRFKKKWFGSRSVTHAEVEEQFWEIVERSTGPVEVLYGSDLDTSVYGSGFPRPLDAVPRWAKQESWEQHRKSPWNLNNFPKLDGSMLRLVGENIPGVIVPWLYVGMLFSSFCWHYEDHCFYSVNYLHWGEPKCWYSVPGDAYNAFEEVMRSTFPDLFQAQPDLLFQLVTMLNPAVLRDKGVPVCTTLQEPGNFVITFPRSYHGGFNHGFNCAEAVNFAPTDWVPFGRFGVERYRLFHKVAVLSHDELLCVVAKNDCTAKSCHWIQKELRRVTSQERRQREELWQRGMVKSCRMPYRSYNTVGTEEDAECMICRYYLHLSAVVCSCRPGKAVCLEHAKQLCECSAEKQCLVYRFSLAEMVDILPSGNLTGEDFEKAREDEGLMLHKKVEGEAVSHTELALAWIGHARSAICTPPPVSVVEDLLRRAEQFLWAGHEMDGVRPLENVLMSVQTWAKDVAACYNAVQEKLHGKGAKVQLARVQELLMADPLPCLEPYVSKLKPMARDACNVQKQIIDCFSASSPPDVRVLQRLQHEVLRLPFEFVEARKLKDVLATAQAWSDRVQKLLSAGKGVKREMIDLPDPIQLMDLQFEGMRLSVMVPEKRLLDVVIKKVESWQQHAKELMASSPFLQEIDEFLCEGEGLPVRLPEADVLKKHASDAHGWSGRAQNALKTVSRSNDYGESVKLLADILAESECIKIQVDELKLVKGQLEIFSWLNEASQALRSKSSTDVLEPLLEAANGLQVSEQSFARELKNVTEKALAWEARAEKALHLGAPYTEFAELARASDKIQASLKGHLEVRSELARVDSWLPRALPFVKYCQPDCREDRVPLDLDNWRDLISEMENSPVILSEFSTLKECLGHVEDWSTRIFKLLDSTRDCLFDQEGNSSQEDRIALLKLRLPELQEAVAVGVPYNFDLSHYRDLLNLTAAAKWSLEAWDLLSASPSVSVMEDHLQDLKRIPISMEHNFVLRLLDGVKCRSKTWLSKVTAIVYEFETRVSTLQLEQLLNESQYLKADIRSEVLLLEQILADHRSWQNEVKKVFDGSSSSTLTLSELLCLQEAGEASLVQSIEMDLLDAEIVGVGAWLVRCEEAVGNEIRRHNSIGDALLWMRRHAELALQSVAYDDCETDDFCVCLQTVEEDDFTSLFCDVCAVRYHSSCLKFTEFQTRTHNQKKFVCPFCAAISTGAVYDRMYAVQQPPKLAVLEELVSAAKNLRCRLEEEELLEAVVELVYVWQPKACTISEPILTSEFEIVDLRVLRLALKGACLLQIEEKGSNEIKQAVAVNAWRFRTRKLLEGCAKPCFRSICRAYEEAIYIPVPVKDSMFQQIQFRKSQASQWVEHAKEVVEDEGKTPLEDVNLLILRGEQLPITFTKELAALRTRSVLYCVCRKPYDEGRAMVGCDRCGEWYHFSCINLPEPEGGDWDCEEYLRDELGPGGEFFCPACKLGGNGSSREHRRLLEGISIASSSVRKRRSRRRLSSEDDDEDDDADDDDDDDDVNDDDDDDGDGDGDGDGEGGESSDGLSTTPRSRPCRRTAGRHSGFDSFVLLMPSR